MQYVVASSINLSNPQNNIWGLHFDKTNHGHGKPWKAIMFKKKYITTFPVSYGPWQELKSIVFIITKLML